MRVRQWAPSILLLALALGGILGGAWWWDSHDYPMPGVPPAPPSPFPYPGWDWSESTVTNLSRLQDRLRSARYGRLKKQWIMELKLADTYWTFRSGKRCAIHFAADGTFTVMMAEGSLPDALAGYHSYERIGNGTIRFYPERGGKGEATEVDMSSINENSILLFAPGSGIQQVIDRSPTSTFFDRLANQGANF